MDNVSLPSGLSSASSRSEHIAYMTAELGLDQPTAAMLYRAERLQEKGQLQQALSYFARVAERKPDCVEAVENARMIRSMLAEQPPSQEAPPRPLPTVSEYQTVEMQVEWEGAENIISDYYPEPRDLAFEAVRRQLRKTGHGHSPLTLIKNEVLVDRCDHETGWFTHMEGLATFQVTLLRDLESPAFSVDQICSIFANMATGAATSTATPTPPATAPSAHAPTAPAAPEWAGAGHGVEAGERVYEELVEQADGSLLARTSPPSSAVSSEISARG